MANQGPEATTSDYDEMAPRWALVRDLLGGTLAMRAAQTTWLPREDKEDWGDYLKRLGRSILYGAYEDTIESLSGKPFVRPVSVAGRDSLQEPLAQLLTDADMTGQNITTFAGQMFYSGISYGLSHLLIDYPRTSGTETLADERRSRYRPWFVLIEGPDLFYWLVNYDDYGRPVLDKIRFWETRIVQDPDNPYASMQKRFIREYTRTEWRVYEQIDKGGKWTVMDEGLHTFPGGVPLVTFYTNRKGYMKATPPLEKLAWCNLAHWQSDSDQRNILRFARLGFVFASGVTQKDVEEQQFVIAPNKFLHSENPDAKVQYVEHSGRAIESGQKDLDKLEERMEVLGLQPLLRKVSSSTATGQAINENRSGCDLQSWVRDLEGVLEDAFRKAVDWNPGALGPLPEDFSIDVFSEFVLYNNSADVPGLLQARKDRVITQRTAIEELKRRGILNEAVSTDDEIAGIAEEGLPLDGMDTPDDDEDGE